MTKRCARLGAGGAVWNCVTSTPAPLSATRRPSQETSGYQWNCSATAGPLKFMSSTLLLDLKS